jgi:hypothetical protein
MKVYERLADAFMAEGTTHVFGMMGDGNMYWMNALIKPGPMIIDSRISRAVINLPMRRTLYGKDE